jgi:hypothetical protein
MSKQSDPSNQAEPDQRALPCVDKAIAKKVEDAWSQRFPNDWLEATIVVVMLAAMAGGAYFMYLLSQA